MPVKRVLVLGGYGNFGKRIVENLATISDIVVYVAGRSEAKATQFISTLQPSAKAQLTPLVVDVLSNEFSEKLAQLSPYLVIHTSGPFQGQDYRVPQACIEHGSHYIDLADDRKFVCDISSLEPLAKKHSVLAVSGASSVPGLSSAAIDHYQSQFDSIDSIDISIAPGNKAERGLATVKAILSYTGHPISVFKDGAWQDVFGWMNSRKNDFGGIVNKRYLANVDVPDLKLFPAHYKVKQRVSFQAGLELPILHHTMVAMAFLTKKGLIKSWEPLAKTIVKVSNIFLGLGSDKGAMQVKICGQKQDGSRHELTWTLYAPNGIGPYIPTLSTIILARKLLQAKMELTGAYPCVSLFDLKEFKPHFEEFGIYYHEQIAT